MYNSFKRFFYLLYTCGIKKIIYFLGLYLYNDARKLVNLNRIFLQFIHISRNLLSITTKPK